MSDRGGGRAGGTKDSGSSTLAENTWLSNATEVTQPLRRTGSRAQWKAQTRERVLVAAGQVFAERGYTDASVSEIASVAGVAVGSLYVHFPNKRELFWAVLARRMEAERRDDEVAGTDVAAYVADYDTRLRETSEDPRSVALLAEMWMHSIRDESFRADLAHHLQESHTRLSRLVHRLRRHAAAGTRPEPDWALSDEHIALIAVSLFRSLAQTRCIDPTSVPEDLFSTTMLHLAQLTRTTTGEG
jgi:AcrR family transcriptional regulator